MTEAWEITIGYPTLLFGMRDTDFDMDHPDLNDAFETIQEISYFEKSQKGI